MKGNHKPSSRMAFVLVALFLLALPYQVFAQQDKAARINELMALYHSYGQFNGSVLVAENGHAIYKRGHGLANIEWNIPNQPDTKFRLGSITKQFTSMLIMQLVEQGKVKLDGKISDYLPDYRRDTGQKITVHQLLSHTSGIPNYTALPGFFANFTRDPYTVDAFIKRYASNDLEFEPGTKFNYSNSGYFLLGAIIEKVTGKPYEQVLREKILDPLGMKNTGYDHYDAIINKRASGYMKTPVGYNNAPYLDMSIPYAAGSLYSTVEDLFLWDQALYTEKLLSAKYRDMMFKPNLENYGYGWIMGKLPLGQSEETVPIIAHDGGINGFSTSIVRLIGDKHLIVLLDNTSQGRRLGQISRGIAGILYSKPYALPKKSVAEALAKTIAEKTAEAALKQYRELKQNQSDAYDFSETELNMLGYQLLALGKNREAIEIFKLNVEMYPQAFNTYDSLGEALMIAGDRALAIKNYKKSLELNPGNTNAVSKLAALEATTITERVAIKADASTYGAYVGEYELAPNFIITVTKEDDRLMAQATAQPKWELFPQAPNEFFYKVVDAQITFVRNDQGHVTSLILHQNGQNINGKKIK